MEVTSNHPLTNTLTLLKTFIKVIITLNLPLLLRELLREAVTMYQVMLRRLNTIRVLHMEGA